MSATAFGQKVNLEKIELLLNKNVGEEEAIAIKVLWNV